MIIDGKKIADELLTELGKEVSDKNLNLSLGAVLVGDDPEFKKFVDLKSRVADRVGISFTTYKFPEDIKTDELKKDMQEILKWSDGVLVELPLPKHIDQQAILNEIPAKKDVDVLSDKAQAMFYKVLPCGMRCVLPPAVEALKIILEKNNISLKGKKVAVFGQGILVGKPIAYWLEEGGAEVFRINSKTKNSEELCLSVDIVVSGVGKPGLINGDMIKEGAVVIDFGYGKKGGKMMGDVDFKSVSKKSNLITPVPGGMGPILTVVVLKNLISLNS